DYRSLLMRIEARIDQAHPSKAHNRIALTDLLDLALP
ncbi:hypothetical protein LCGC14_1951210, partial [marine sediment metagenome]